MSGALCDDAFGSLGRASIRSQVEIATEAVAREQLEDPTMWTRDDTAELMVSVRELNAAVERLRAFELVNSDEPSLLFRFGDEGQ